MIEEFERPNVPEITKEILKGIVPDSQMGTDFVDSYGKFYEQNGYDPVTIEDLDYVVFRRRGGYLTPEFTDVIGLEVHTLARTQERSFDLMQKVANRLLNSEGKEYKGFQVDFCMTLNGPEEDVIDSMDDRIMVESYELHIRVNWT